MFRILNKILLKIPIISFFIIFWIISGCTGNRITRNTGSPGIMNNQSYIKLHMRNGDVYLMNKWYLDSNRVIGEGTLYNYNREQVETNSFRVPVKDVALAETNTIGSSVSTSIMMIPTIVTGIAGIICAASPKTCFGSCPTFYVNDGTEYLLQAEGFSSSVSTCLEAKDIDALYNFKPSGNKLDIQVRNEAYETHFIRKVNILALPKREGNRVLAGDGAKFFEVNNFTEAVSIRGNEGDCSEKCCSLDGVERYTSADSTNLCSKEMVDITFDNVAPGKKGLVIASRQSLLMTYIFYQGLAYMGNTAGEYFAKLENDTATWKNLMQNIRTKLGDIEIYKDNDNGIWEKIGNTGEYGPIASDIKIVPFNVDENMHSVNLKLKMTKGFWRIDYIALTDIVDTVLPVLLKPSDAYPEKDKKGSDIVKLLTDDDSLLVTFPGDKYFLHYELPVDFTDYEYFIESQGYYLEWIREEWLREENPAMVAKMFFNSNQYFKDLAPLYKKIEAGMEETFWSSKYVNP